MCCNAGADNGRFVIDSHSGEVRLTRHVKNRLLTPTLRLRVMVKHSEYFVVVFGQFSYRPLLKILNRKSPEELLTL